MRNCDICRKPIVLVPSASERSRQTGKSAAYFENLFTMHDYCALKKRSDDTYALIRRLNAQQ